MIKKIKDNIWAFEFSQFGSIVYLVKLNNKNIIIDTGSPANKEELISSLEEMQLSPENIDVVILTHYHFDHVGNANLFTKAKIYASKEDFKEKEIIDIDELEIPEFKIIKTPGHSKGGICILYEDVLFSGDTIFNNGLIGRMDLEGGSREKMKQSLEKLSKVEYKILCPGH